MTADTKPCPMCAEPIALAAIKCKHCHHVFGQPPSPGPALRPPRPPVRGPSLLRWIPLVLTFGTCGTCLYHCPSFQEGFDRGRRGESSAPEATERREERRPRRPLVEEALRFGTPQVQRQRSGGIYVLVDVTNDSKDILACVLKATIRRGDELQDVISGPEPRIYPGANAIKLIGWRTRFDSSYDHIEMSAESCYHVTR